MSPHETQNNESSTSTFDRLKVIGIYHERYMKTLKKFCEAKYEAKKPESCSFTHEKGTLCYIYGQLFDNEAKRDHVNQSYKQGMQSRP